jgi:hypothetical protein
MFVGLRDGLPVCCERFWHGEQQRRGIYATVRHTYVREHTDRTPRAVRPVASVSRATEPCLPCPRRSVPRRHRSKPR